MRDQCRTASESAEAGSLSGVDKYSIEILELASFNERIAELEQLRSQKSSALTLRQTLPPEFDRQNNCPVCGKAVGCAKTIRPLRDGFVAG